MDVIVEAANDRSTEGSGSMAPITERETRQVEQANASGRTPVVFIHGLWVLPSSWDNWAQLFEEAGYAAVTPVWPDDPETEDHTVPWAIANASYKRQKRNPGVTEIVEIPNRGHSLTIDSGWREVAETALAFVKRFV
jgi:pimeloyl-ACP methyl ester carboxylesterase